MLVKKEVTSQVGKKKNELPIEELIDYGIVNIDKPAGPTSHMVSDYVQRILHINKAGHSGSLDPQVTGVLPVTLGRSTRVVQILLKSPKEYVGIMHLHKPVSEEKLQATIEKFRGVIEQIPPIKSAVRRRKRKRTIYAFEILEIEDQDVLFRVSCQAGTYIRKICHDLGVSLGVGAHMAQLRRTKAGPFDESTLITLHDLADACHYLKEGDESLLRSYIQPVEHALQHTKKIWVLPTSVESITHGRDLAIPGISKLDEGIKKDEIIAIMSLDEGLIALGVAEMSSEEIMQAQKGRAAKVEKVFMKTS